MKLLCIADVHADFSQFAPDSLPDADVCLLAGDITNAGQWRPQEVADARNWISDLRRRFPVFWVAGNHDIEVDGADFRFTEGNKPGLHSVRCLLPDAFVRQGSNGRREEDAFMGVEWRGRTFVGQALCTAFDYPQLAQQWAYTTADVDEDMRTWDNTPPAQLVVSHCPPLGILDSAGRVYHRETGMFGETRHIGSPGLLAYIERHSPRLVVCGHAHGNVGETLYGRTRVVNTAQTATLVTLEDA